MSAEIVWLSDRRIVEEADPEIDLATAIDVAIRDLAEIDRHWGSYQARQRLAECHKMLVQVLEES